MDFIKGVFDLAKEFMKNPKHAKMNYGGLIETSKLMKTNGVSSFGYDNEVDKFKFCLFELVGNSINYCYWYGKSDIRPCGSSSRMMYTLLEKAFKNYQPFYNFADCIEDFVQLLALNRFPMLEERKNHLTELIAGAEFLSEQIVQQNDDPTEYIETIIQSFPGYASDMFLKRLSLFFIQLNRRFGWFQNAMTYLHVPADYQVPKKLRHYNCITYSDELAYLVDNELPIQKHSPQECEIRAATILACKALMEYTGWGIAEIDAWFWLKRNEVNKPFHLTITTDY
jgi:hypothetical protein